jgi:predicted transcriptional regulator
LLKDKNAVVVLENNKVVDIITTIDVINYLMKRESETVNPPQSAGDIIHAS